MVLAARSLLAHFCARRPPPPAGRNATRRYRGRDTCRRAASGGNPGSVHCGFPRAGGSFRIALHGVRRGLPRPANASTHRWPAALRRGDIAAARVEAARTQAAARLSHYVDRMLSCFCSGKWPIRRQLPVAGRRAGQRLSPSQRVAQTPAADRPPMPAPGRVLRFVHAGARIGELAHQQILVDGEAPKPASGSVPLRQLRRSRRSHCCLRCRAAPARPHGSTPCSAIVTAIASRAAGASPVRARPACAMRPTRRETSDDAAVIAGPQAVSPCSGQVTTPVRRPRMAARPGTSPAPAARPGSARRRQ